MFLQEQQTVFKTRDCQAESSIQSNVKSKIE